MKYQIRKSVFETNSSSTHSIAIPKIANPITSVVHFDIGEFGWSFQEEDPASYFYTALCVTSDSKEEMESRIAKVKSILDDNGIEYVFGEVVTGITDCDGEDYFYIDNGYIDHPEYLYKFVDELLNDSGKLIRFLSEGLVFTGHDNCESSKLYFVGRCKKEITEYNYKTKTSETLENPYYMENHADYDWYYKYN